MRVEQLILEVTRVCNMSCKHCLRGCSQNVYMTKEMVDKIFEDIESVGSILFTGGEPFLNLDIIEYTLEVVKSKNIFVGEFFIITNGKHYEKRQIDICNAWIEYIMSMNYNLDESVSRKYSYCNEDIFNYSGIAVSLDEYHEEIPLENYFKYRMLAYYSTVKEHSDNEKFELINEGNAKTNGIGKFNRDYSELSISADAIDSPNGVQLENIEIDGILYVSANGNILGDCDMSYEHADAMSVGNIKDNSLFEIIREKYLEENELSA